MSTSNRLYVARSGASATASAPVALAANTPKTVISLIGTANLTPCIKRVRVSFASVTVTDVPALVELGIITALGTVTSFTPVQLSGSSVASQVTAGYNATAEPTFNRIIESTYVPVNNGFVEWWYPLGEEPQADPSQGFALRVTSPQVQNCYASLLYQEG